jgi:predicted  nucleic acid-binding Zn-ribbon protein
MAMSSASSFALLLSLLAPAGDDDVPINFADHVEPILRANCYSCHKGRRAKNGLDMRKVSRLLEGGSSGPAIVPGDSGSSRLYLSAARLREPFMPPRGEPLTDADLAILKQWIDAGARATADGAPVAAAAATAPAYVPPPPPAGAAVMPESLSTQPRWWTERGGTVTAVATSPFAPLAAVAGREQVSLWGIPGGELLGVLDFPEGAVHSLRFSPSGALLVAGGGRGGDSGLAVGWDVQSGQRVFTLGDEPELVLDADVSADHARVVLGGVDRVVRTYAVGTGEQLYEIDVHTDWVTACAFSPDGVLLATGDRAGGLFVWEAQSGREFHVLEVEESAVTGIDWRADSNVLAVANAKGTVRLFDMEKGRRTRRWSAHGGVLSLRFVRDGQLVTAGRDGRARVWNQEGKQVADLGRSGELTTAVAALGDGSHVVVGDFEGEVRVVAVESKQSVATLRPNPSTDEEREAAAAQAALVALEAELPPLEEARARAETALAAVRGRDGQVTTAAAQVEQRASLAEASYRKLDAELQQAAVRRQSFERPLVTRRAAESDSAARSEQLAGEEEIAQAALQAAVRRTVEAEERFQNADDDGRAAAEETRNVAEDLLDGASAACQLAASRAAQARVDLDRRRSEAELWDERARPVLAAHDALVVTTEASASKAVASREEARAATREADALREELTAAQTAAVTATEGVERISVDLDAARSRLAAAQAAHAAMREHLASSGGRVR